MITRRTQSTILLAVGIAVSIAMPLQAQLFPQWQVTLGGTNYEECTAILVTEDGGCVVAGGSVSEANGNKTAPRINGADYWLVRLNGDGDIIWDRTYGGTSAEYPNGLQKAADGGYVLAGWSRSGMNGNKISEQIGGSDYWLVKTDPLGIKQWDVAFGGTFNETAWHLASVVDGYLLTGASYSGISGNKTSPNLGEDDGWVVKVDTNGVKQWEMAYGGTTNDYLYWAEPTADGGFILTGDSESLPSGNKTSPNYGSFDAWVIKIDSGGNKVWETTLGGTNRDYFSFVHLTPDGGCFVGAGSNSEPGGNKTSPNHGFWDWWLVKLDSDGNKEWEQSYGGEENDYLKGVQPYEDGYLLFGTSWSDVSGNKTVEKFGTADYWLVKIDTLGNIKWQQVIGGFDIDYAVEALQPTPDGGFILGGYSEYGGSGNKTVTSFGDFDYWIVKLVPAPALEIAPAAPGQVTISWGPDSPGWVLQETAGLNPTNWMNSASGSMNPVTVPSTDGIKLYRLFMP